MAKYDVTYSCGHSGEVVLFGAHKDRERKLEWYSKTAVCPKCYAAACEEEKQKNIAAMMDKQDEFRLPALTGSEKQVAWALKIRDKFIADFEEAKRKFGQAKQLTVKIYNILYANALKNEESKWWIDNRETLLANFRADWKNFDRTLAEYFGFRKPSERPEGETIENDAGYAEALNFPDDEFYTIITKVCNGEQVERGITPVTSEEIELSAEAEAEKIIRPQSNEKGMTAKITRVVKDDGGGFVAIQMPERVEGLYNIFRKNGFAWDHPKWVMSFLPNRRDVDDRIIEMAVNILSRGYTVSVPEKWMAERVLKADYQPIKTRRIRVVGDKFAISWDRDDGDFYKAVKMIGQTRWSKDNQAVLVAPERFLEVLDFAERFDFELSDKSKELIERARIIQDKALVGDVTPLRNIMPNLPEDKPQKLDLPKEAGIDESLRDDD